MALFWNVVAEFFEVIVVGIILGAGLPTLYALGLKALAWGAGAGKGHTAENPGPKHPAGKWIAYAIFTFAGTVILLGLTTIILSGFGIKLFA